MSDASRAGDDSLPLSLEQCIDPICCRFEEAWQSGQRPPIEPYLSEGPPETQAALLRELLAVELAYRRQAGESPTLDEYQRRFPEQATLLEELFAREEGLRSTSVDEPTATVLPPPAAAGGARYRSLRLHAKGGLGEVHVAHDAELHREVALKRIQHRHADNPESRRRFLLEAEVTGRLEHPGVVPVYGMGHDKDGQPCYAMRFIQGETLREAIQRFHAGEQAARDPAERRLALRGLLTRFVAVCNTVAYAHSRGVIHRDLKPANVMLGQYGETLVVDWGLAKCVSQSESGSEREGEGASDEERALTLAHSHALTQPGAAAGTPGYMSPEQAAGRWDEVGPASDLYSLGATLYEILVGRRPVVGASVEEVVERTQRGDFPPLRQVNKQTPPALEAVCLKAMALRPEDRYATATELAGDVERWLADEPVSVYRGTVAEQLRRWARRHRGLAAAATALLLAALAASGGFGLWWKQQRDATVAAVAEHLEQCEGFRLEERWPEALQALERAEARRAGGGPAWLAERIERLRGEIDAVNRLEEARLEAATESAEGFDFTGVDEAYGKVFADLGLDVFGPDQEALAGRITRSPLRKQLAVALDDWAFVRSYLRFGGAEQLLAVARRVDDDALRQQLRDPAVRRDRAALEELANQADAPAQPPANVVLLSRLLTAAKGRDTAEELLKDAQQRRPTDFWINFELAFNLGKKEDNGEAIGSYRAALALRPQSVVVHNNLGILLSKYRRTAEAERAYRTAIQIKPNYALAHYNLGYLLLQQKRPGEAEGAYRAAIHFKRNFASAHYNLGILLKEQKRPAEAEQAYRAAIQIRSNDPKARSMLGDLLREQGRPDEAEEELRAALKIKPDYAEAHYNLGVLLAEQKRPDEAEQAYRAALEVKPDFAEAYTSLGVLLAEQKRPDEAEEAFRTVIQIKPDAYKAHSNLGAFLKEQGRPAEAEQALRTAIQIQPEYAPAHYNLGFLLKEQKRSAEAEQAYRAALKARPDFAEAHNNLGFLLREQRRPAEAEQAYRAAIRAKPNFAEAHNNLGGLLEDQKRPAEAEQAYRAAIKAKPDFAEAYYNLGILLKEQKRPAEAEQAYRAAIKTRPDFAEAYCNLGVLLNEQKRPTEAERAYRAALHIKPDYPEANYSLGARLHEQKRAAEAEAAYRAALKARADYAEAHNNLGVLLQEQGRLAEAEQAYRAAIKLRPDYAEAHNNLGALLREQKRPTEAEAAYRRAIQIQPDHASAHYNLGILLAEHKRPAEAEAAFRTAIKIHPGYAEAHNNLGNLLAAQKRPAEAEQAFRAAIKARPDYAIAFNNLGFVLAGQKRPAEAEAAYRAAIQIRPDFALAHNNLGFLLLGQDRLDEAIDAFQKSIHIDPRRAQIHTTLGQALLRQGRLTEARDATQRALDLVSPQHPLHKVVTQQLDQCVQLLKLEAKLPALIKKDIQPRDAAEQLALARLCQTPAQRLYAAAARFYGDAFTADPKAAGAHRVLAARAAARAGCGQGKDADTLDQTQRAQLRQQALAWLQEELTKWGKQLEANPEKARATVHAALQLWQKDADLAGVHAADALARLAEGEQQAWRQFWADVEALRKRAEAPR